mmetsp:Transcript_28006/g.96817  ORF Transcript_28006/g.96817 Transcript_28006/m.96817 type:complete len:341 (-) Transcript_28006:76-1098(-)
MADEKSTMVTKTKKSSSTSDCVDDVITSSSRWMVPEKRLSLKTRAMRTRRSSRMTRTSPKPLAAITSPRTQNTTMSTSRSLSGSTKYAIHDVDDHCRMPISTRKMTMHPASKASHANCDTPLNSGIVSASSVMVLSTMRPRISSAKYFAAGELPGSFTNIHTRCFSSRSGSPQYGELDASWLPLRDLMRRRRADTGVTPASRKPGFSGSSSCVFSPVRDTRRPRGCEAPSAASSSSELVVATAAMAATATAGPPGRCRHRAVQAPPAAAAATLPPIDAPAPFKPSKMSTCATREARQGDAPCGGAPRDRRRWPSGTAGKAAHVGWPWRSPSAPTRARRDV